jgi:hypothetical protein
MAFSHLTRRRDPGDGTASLRPGGASVRVAILFAVLLALAGCGDDSAGTAGDVLPCAPSSRCAGVAETPSRPWIMTSAVRRGVVA